jgi:hypothetical protein
MDWAFYLCGPLGFLPELGEGIGCKVEAQFLIICKVAKVHKYLSRLSSEFIIYWNPIKLSFFRKY